MLRAAAVLLLLFALFGLAGLIEGGLFHLLLTMAVALLLIELFSGRKPPSQQYPSQ